jgi:hypothetical protein
MLGKTSTVGDLLKAGGIGLIGGLAAGVAIDQALEFLDRQPEFASGKTSRLKEVINVAKSIKTPSLKIILQEKFRKNEMVAHEVGN